MRSSEAGSVQKERARLSQPLMGAGPPPHTQSTTPPHITYPPSGIRQDHRTASRPGGGKGWRFFVEDEDEFGLEGLLQVCAFIRDWGPAFGFDASGVWV